MKASRLQHFELSANCSEVGNPWGHFCTIDLNKLDRHQGNWPRMRLPHGFSSGHILGWRFQPKSATSFVRLNNLGSSFISPHIGRHIGLLHCSSSFSYLWKTGSKGFGSLFQFNCCSSRSLTSTLFTPCLYS